MRKSILLLSAVVCFILIVYYFFLYSEKPLQLSDDESSEPFRLPFKIPFISPESEEESTGSGAGLGAGSEEGGGSGGPVNETLYVPSIYVLSVDSIPSQLDVYMEYEFNDTVFNSTQPTPFSLEIEESTVVCVADATGYSGIFWLLDEVGCEFNECGEFEWGCSILMDGNHIAMLRQYS
jgi:hypothetical protein